MTNRADSLEMSIRKRKQFEATRPREEALKLLRYQRQHYLLNRSRFGIDELRYRSWIAVELSRDESPRQTFTLVDLPSKSFVGIGSVPRAAQRKRIVTLIRVCWADGVESEFDTRMREWSPHDGGTTAAGLELSYVPRIPTLACE